MDCPRCGTKMYYDKLGDRWVCCNPECGKVLEGL
jgi:hypothetical protein